MPVITETASQINAELRNKYNNTGVLDRDLDKQALQVYFQDEVNRHTLFTHSQKEKLRYLVEKGYYEKEFLEKYEERDVLDLYQSLYDYKFRFQTYIAAKVFYTSYALKSFDNECILERYEDRIGTVALYLADGDIALANRLAKDMIQGIYQPATPTFQNCGKKSRGELVSCFLLCIKDDLPSINRSLASIGALSKIGGGVGLCLTNVRERQAPIKGFKDRAKGILPIAKQAEAKALYVDQLGTRPGQVAVWIHACHYDVTELLDARRAVDSTDPSFRLTDLNIGVVIPDILYKLAAEHKDFAMFSPYDVKRVTGKEMTNISMTEWYWKLYKDESVRRKYIDAEEFFNKLSALQGESGFPYILNEDTVNKLNPNKGRISFSNLCSEIMQTFELSDIEEDLSYSHVGKDISCNLGSLNIANLFEHGDRFEEIIDNSMTALTQVSLFSNIKSVPSIVRGNKESHSVGLGVMNYHGFLASKDIVYGSKDSIIFTDLFFSTLRFYALKASCRLAKEKGETYKGFEDSKYATGEELSRYIDTGKEYPENILKIFTDSNVVIPTNDMWKELDNDIRENGLFNAYHLAIAPTGNISYVSNATASIAPITSRVEGRQSKAIGTAYYPMPFLNDNNAHLFKTAYEMDYKDMIDLYAAATPHVDQGISCTLYATHATTISQLNGMRNYAWAKGLKSLYYIRFANDGDDPRSNNSTVKMELGNSSECEACSI